ncbi:MAG: glucosamine-6-phosphate deaminase [Citrobacter freundii]|nr:MAG: glucosamine-6-phosphate deaminase [Citrobacter freundii]
MTDFVADQLKVRIYEDRPSLGVDAARMAAESIRLLLKQKTVVNIIFAAAASQNEFLEALIKEDIDWQSVQAFHMDEYIGLPENDPQLFGEFLRKKIFDRVPFKKIFYLNGQAKDLEAECKRYANLLVENPVDITCMGIGENTHLAFNDPHVAEFNDPKLVKVVDLDEACKQQQVNEGCFADVSKVPVYAFTLTIPALLKAGTIFCMVPGTTKAQAVYHTLKDEVTETYPSTILRKHAGTWLFLEKESAAKISAETKTLVSA